MHEEMGKSNGYISHKHFLVTSLNSRAVGFRDWSLRTLGLCRGCGEGLQAQLGHGARRRPSLQPEAPMTPALAFGQLNVGTKQGAVSTDITQDAGWGAERQRVGHTCEAVWTAGLAWLLTPTPGPCVPYRDAQGLTHTTIPGPGSSVGVGGRGWRLGTRRGHGLAGGVGR